MKEVEVDNKWIEENGKDSTKPADATTTGPGNDAREIDKAILVMLMRLYDVQMAILTKTDPKQADNIFDAHDRGDLFNPQIFVPGD